MGADGAGLDVAGSNGADGADTAVAGTGVQEEDTWMKIASESGKDGLRSMVVNWDRVGTGYSTAEALQQGGPKQLLRVRPYHSCLGWLR